MKNFIGKILSENSGDLSSMRIFDWQEVSVIVGALFAKAYQKGKEK
jgi:hypothetical protein